MISILIITIYLTFNALTQNFGNKQLLYRADAYVVVPKAIHPEGVSHSWQSQQFLILTHDYIKLDTSLNANNNQLNDKNDSDEDNLDASMDLDYSGNDEDYDDEAEDFFDSSYDEGDISTVIEKDLSIEDSQRMSWIDDIEDDEDEDEYDDGEGNEGDNNIMTELDESVQSILQNYQDAYEEFKTNANREASKSPSSFPIIPIIQGWLIDMNEWDTIQYNQLLKEISQTGSIRDAEAILYHMIQLQNSQNENGLDKTFLVNDETFYHVFATYRSNGKQQKNRSQKSKRYKGVAYKVEQLLAIQDAISSSTTLTFDQRAAMQPSIQTLNMVVTVMTLDRHDNRVALRARRIWDRIVLLGNDSEDGNHSILTKFVVPTLICCTHLPRETASPNDKLSAFTVALDCFNWATTRERLSEGDDEHQQQILSFVYFLRSCRTLLSETTASKRDAVIEAAFRRACNNGYVNNKVIKSFEEVASDELILRMLGGFIEDGQNFIPNEWSRNVSGKRQQRNQQESAVQ